MKRQAAAGEKIAVNLKDGLCLVEASRKHRVGGIV